MTKRTKKHFEKREILNHLFNLAYKSGDIKLCVDIIKLIMIVDGQLKNTPEGIEAKLNEVAQAIQQGDQ